MSDVNSVVHAWRHPRAAGADGRCIGRTDLAVDRRKSKRLARRIQAFARRHALPHEVITSPSRRCRDVGRWLARWGWRHHIDAALSEFDFGDWDGRAWSDVSVAEVDAWCNDFVHHRPGGGENVSELMVRVGGFAPGSARVLVTHGGWLSAALWQRAAGGQAPSASRWRAPPRPGQHVVLRRDQARISW